VSIGKRIIDTARQKGYNQRDIANALGISPSAVSDWVKKGSTPSGKRLSRLSELLGVSIEYLVSGNETGSRTSNDQSFTKQEVELLRIYNKITAKNQALLLIYAFELEEKNNNNE